MKNLALPLAVLIASLALYAQEYPKAEITNGVIKASLYLPDAEKGSYRATRFDWSGVIYSLTYKGHEYYGRWYAKHDPLVHDAITGPAESFDTAGAGPGYAEAKPGGSFLRLGVGLVEKIEEPAFNPFRTYKVVDPGQWTVKKGKDWIEFTQRLPDKIGYGYIYTKRISLHRGAPEMVISHSLKNTGAKVIETTQYNHNFFVIDGKPSGPGITVRFPFDLRATSGFKGLLEVRGRELVFLKELTGQQSVQSLLEGFGASAKDYDITVENRNAGAGARITADRPIVRINFWTRRETFCPEPYIQLRIEPGRTEKWVTRYQYFTLK
jgi:hypothetical protein